VTVPRGGPVRHWVTRACSHLAYARDYEVRDGLLLLATVVIEKRPAPGAATH
jgi:hypothetical protein